MNLPDWPNKRWSLGFLKSAFNKGMYIRNLVVVDDYSREYLTLTDTSLSGVNLTREQDAIIARRGKPKTIVSDNDTEMNSKAVLRSCQDTSKGNISLRVNYGMKLLRVLALMRLETNSAKWNV